MNMTPTYPSPADVVGRLLERPGDVTGAPEWVRVAQDGSDMRGGFWTCAAAHEGSPKFIRADLVASAITALEARSETAEAEAATLRKRVGALTEALRDLAEAARNACDARRHTALTEALFNADAALANKEIENV